MRASPQQASFLAWPISAVQWNAREYVGCESVRLWAILCHVVAGTNFPVSLVVAVFWSCRLFVSSQDSWPFSRMNLLPAPF